MTHSNFYKIIQVFNSWLVGFHSLPTYLLNCKSMLYKQKNIKNINVQLHYLQNKNMFSPPGLETENYQ